MKKTQTDLLQGTLDLLALKTLQSGLAYGWDIAQRIQQVSQDVIVGQGSLYPALAPVGGVRLDRFGVGRVGEQPEGEILQADRRRPETVRGRDVEAFYRGSVTDFENVLKGRIWPCSTS